MRFALLIFVIYDCAHVQFGILLQPLPDFAFERLGHEPLDAIHACKFVVVILLAFTGQPCVDFVQLYLELVSSLALAVFDHAFCLLGKPQHVADLANTVEEARLGLLLLWRWLLLPVRGDDLLLRRRHLALVDDLAGSPPLVLDLVLAHQEVGDVVLLDLLLLDVTSRSFRTLLLL